MIQSLDVPNTTSGRLVRRLILCSWKLDVSSVEHHTSLLFFSSRCRAAPRRRAVSSTAAANARHNATLRPPKVNLETDFWNQFSLLTYRDSSCYSLFLLNHENCDLEKNILIPLFLSFKKKLHIFLLYICFQVILKIQI